MPKRWALSCLCLTNPFGRVERKRRLLHCPGQAKIVEDNKIPEEDIHVLYPKNKQIYFVILSSGNKPSTGKAGKVTGICSKDEQK